jgi:hypothetical protein
VITPTVGRIVWYKEAGFADETHQPNAAIVTYVWSDVLVNLAVFSENGIRFAKTSVRLLQDDETSEGHGEWCEWMPFQKDQAQRYAAREGDKVPDILNQKPEQGSAGAEPASS